VSFQDFRTWLQQQPIAPSSMRVYLTAANALVRRFGEDPTPEQLNAFIAHKAARRQQHAKYGVRWYLQFRGRLELYKDLVRARVRKPVRQKFHLPRGELKRIAAGLSSDNHRGLFWLQYFCSLRAHDALTLEPRFLELEEDTERGVPRLRLMVTAKGDNPRVVYVYHEGLRKWLLAKATRHAQRELMFVDGDAHKQQPLQRETRISTVYKRYEEDVRQAAAGCGYEGFATHDLRRSFVSALEEHDVPDAKAKHAGGWTTQEAFERYRRERDQERDTEEVLFAHQSRED